MLRYEKQVIYSRQLKSNIIQLTKRQAAHYFDKDCTLYMIPNKMRLDNVWQPLIDVSKKDDETFDNVYNSFVYYNCDTFRGKTPCIFIKEQDYKNTNIKPTNQNKLI